MHRVTKAKVQNSEVQNPKWNIRNPKSKIIIQNHKSKMLQYTKSEIQNQNFS